MKREEIPDTYDAIVIGSGISGMATASIIAQMRKWKVLVVESHFTLGGYTHAFKRKGYEWDPGFHYVGEMEPGTQTRDCMDLVTGGQVEWQKLDEGFEQLVFPDVTLEVPSSPEEHKELLKKEFPDEIAGIEQYFEDIYKMRNWSTIWYFSKLFPNWLSKLVSAGKKRKLAETLTQDYLDEHIKNPLLKAVLTSQWGDYGTPPGRSAFGVHGMVAADFMAGGYYAIGGAQKISHSAKQMVESFGGHCMTRHKVTEILIENNKAKGVAVETKHGPRSFYAPRIISAAGIDTTFNKLVPETYAKKEREKLKNHIRGVSATILFMGIKDDPRKYGYKDTNYWMFDKLDHRYEDKKEFPPSIGNTTLSFASLRNPSLKKHVAQLVTFSAYDDWEDHSGTVWRKRGDEYAKKKEIYIETLLDFVEERFPGLRDIIEFRELSTPLTFESMTNHVNGQVYGRECNQDRIKEDWNIQTSVKNLYLTGSDICIPGINSALMMGVMTASRFVQPYPLGITRVLKHAASGKKVDLSSLLRADA
ncbi:MAG: phytoene desaturase family protein [Granulosicoccus sp.]